MEVVRRVALHAYHKWFIYDTEPDAGAGAYHDASNHLYFIHHYGNSL